MTRREGTRLVRKMVRVVPCLWTGLSGIGIKPSLRIALFLDRFAPSRRG